METGIKTRSGDDRYVEDCTVETDQPAFIPDDYIDIHAEKIRIYKQLDSVTSDKELDRFRTQIADRFGPLPAEVENLFHVVRIRNLGVQRGFEKIIVKNGLQIMFFVNNPMSGYYNSATFGKIIDSVNKNSTRYNFSQKDGKLRIISRNIPSLEAAYANLSRL